MQRRGTFGPVVLLGLGAAGLAAVAGHRPLVRLAPGALDGTGMSGYADALDRLGADDGLPLAGALALVLLAGWGVLLVTRGLVRRGVAGGLVLVGLGLLTTTVVGGRRLLGDFPDDVATRLGGPSHLEGTLPVETTAWFWALLVAAVIATAAAGLAVVLAPAWPEMGSRYDAPAGAAASDLPLEERSSIDVWKSLDEGDDPTA